MDIYNHRRLSNALFHMQDAMEAFDPFFDEDSLYSEDEEFMIMEEENWEEEGEAAYYEKLFLTLKVVMIIVLLVVVVISLVVERVIVVVAIFILNKVASIVLPINVYELEIELSGHDKKDIKIEIPNNRTLTLEGTGKPENKRKAAERKGKGYGGNKKRKGDEQQQQQKQPPTADSSKLFLGERSTDGNFSRNYGFPIPFSSKNIKASYENGVLKIVLPKYNKDVVAQIQIE